MSEDENIVKRVCRELGITQRELSEILGVHLVSVQKWVANANDLPLQTQKSLNLVLENHHLKNKVDKINTILKLIDEIKNS
ncbi:transcriptional regulator [Campylobacter hyointestinalis]|uniref:Transcriptional regulator n=1 Tax=Campylobacter hyointestinalis subsp. hyointestinalis TaxID=91352 RepID=A0A855N4M9_CAMHY|nr:transcriptional regulator [Campylobacter hyointestinalis]ANE32867.1 hypothetical protein CHH_1233 [Campylobacter hyointestinalis subsp. hyointestinalis LMG 9260]KEA43683.1 DNA-binding protein [Campylobacter hyointestinalis subsp. hyointestinalis]MBT0612918.1 transcriptional regulator [Campylobacter hyointestinalis subsp. hyointestinalis]MDL2347689.1 transcriptional regulator [Campylobacter hyointestinalis]MDL2349432.1 transcriptional regulator [Campylobacter hyointestinalis]